MEIKPDVETFAKIKVVGVGGSGGSTLNKMIQEEIRGVDFIAINTDIQALQHSLAPIKLNVGKSITKGLGAGMDPDMGRKAAEENQNEIREVLGDADMVFITCGLGGGTGTGAAPVIANIAKELGALTIAVVTKPFTFEGSQRKLTADKGHENIIGKVDTIITIPNDRILQLIDKKTSLLEAFSVVDDVLLQGVQGIAELVTVHGLTNVDFADVKSIMQNSGSAIMGIGYGKGENRAIEAAKAAIECPLLETSIVGATGVLFTVTGGKDFGMFELTDAAKVITEQVAPDARIIYGTIIDDDLADGIKVTVVATGFGDLNIANSNSTKKMSSPGSTPIVNSSPQSTKYSPPKFNSSPSSNISKYRAPEEQSSSSFDSSERNTQSFSSSSSGDTAINFQSVDIDSSSNNPVSDASSNSSVNLSLDDDNDNDLEIPAFIRKKML